MKVRWLPLLVMSLLIVLAAAESSPAVPAAAEVDGLDIASTSSGPGDIMEVFSFTGSAQSFVVPDDISCIAIDAEGAQGGEGANPDGDQADGGRGGRAQAEIEVTPGETLMVYVGGQGGTPAGGFNGGGDGGDSTQDDGGGGGGASDVRRAPYGLAGRLVVGGGGGGGGGDNDPGTAVSSLGGGGGGLMGGNGAASASSSPSPGGGGGTQTAGGSAPAAFDPTAMPGALGQGGTGGVGLENDDAGGGGGGGYHGGGGGAGENFDEENNDGAGGGGGGSGFGPEGVTFESGVRAGQGRVEISNCAPPPVVFLHGFAGSTINCGAENLWPGPPPDFDPMQLAADGVSPGPEACAVTVGGLLESVQVAGYPVSDVYGSTANFLRTTFEDKAHFFAWDWRKSPEGSIALLDDFIEDVLAQHDDDQVVLMAHSYGGLLARAYLESPARADKVARVVTIGTPAWGAPKALFPLFAGIETPDFSELDLIITDNMEFKNWARNLAGNYFLYPSASYGEWLTVDNVALGQSQVIDYVSELGGNRDLLTAAFTAHSNILDGTPPATIPFEIVVGRGLPTIAGVRIQDNGFVIVEYANGDGTVPAVSAARGVAGPGNPNAARTHYACGVSHVPLPGDDQVTSGIEEFLRSGAAIEGLAQSPCPASGLQFRIFELEALPAGAQAGVESTEAITPEEADFAGEVDYLDLPNEKFIVTGDSFPDMVLPPAAYLEITKLGDEGEKGEKRLYGPLSGEITVSPGGDWPVVLQDGVPVEPNQGEERTWGDNNCSGNADPVDALLALRFDAGLPTNTGACPAMGVVVEVLGASPHPWGDIDCTGDVGPVDGLKLLRFDSGLSVSQEPDCPVVGGGVVVAGEALAARSAARPASGRWLRPWAPIHAR
ncbi:MAG: alpha/beta fold hydrolase [Dehalococcoidia bacterium]